MTYKYKSKCKKKTWQKQIIKWLGAVLVLEIAALILHLAFSKIEIRTEAVIRLSSFGATVAHAKEPSVIELIEQNADEYGVSRTLMTAMADCESDFNPKASSKISSARGLYQYIRGTWAEYVQKRGLNWTLEDRFDADKSADMTAYIISKGGLRHWKADSKSYKCWGWAEFK